jgi:hypothetical protein
MQSALRSFPFVVGGTTAAELDFPRMRVAAEAGFPRPVKAEILCEFAEYYNGSTGIRKQLLSHHKSFT